MEQVMEIQKIGIDQLTPEAKLALMAELEKELERKEKDRQANIGSYKNLVEETLQKTVPEYYDFSLLQKQMVEQAHKDFASLIELKTDLYNTKDTQNSHTFTSRDGLYSVTIGYNTIIEFDGTESEGVKKIKEFIETLSADDQNRKKLGGLVNTFMKPDKKGNLNPSRIAELSKQKEEINHPLFTDGVDIIVKAQFVTRTSLIVRGWHKIKDENGNDKKVSFSITA